MIEIWKDIKGYEGLYQVSNLGRVKSLGNNKRRKEKILKQVEDGGGYLFVLLCKNGKGKMFKVHRLVAQAFTPNPNNYPQVNHKDENKQNNCVWNLEWCDCKYNINYGTGIERRIEKVSKTVLQYDLNGNFIREFLSGTEVQRQLGFGFQHISHCCLGKRKTAYGFIWRYKEESAA